MPVNGEHAWFLRMPRQGVPCSDYARALLLGGGAVCAEKG